MAGNDPKITEYTMVQVRFEDYDLFRADGFKVTQSRDVTLEYDGSSEKAFSRTKKQEKIEWELVKPRDHAILHKIFELCNQGYTFTIIVLAKNKDGEWKVMERLDDCDIPELERELGSFEAPKLTIKGTALDRTVKNTQFK